MVDPRQRRGFAFEPVVGGAAQRRRPEDLHRDATLQRLVHAEIHTAVAAFADEPLEVTRADLRAEQLVLRLRLDLDGERRRLRRRIEQELDVHQRAELPDLRHERRHVFFGVVDQYRERATECGQRVFGEAVLRNVDRDERASIHPAEVGDVDPLGGTGEPLEGLVANVHRLREAREHAPAQPTIVARTSGIHQVERGPDRDLADDLVVGGQAA